MRVIRYVRELAALLFLSLLFGCGGRPEKEQTGDAGGMLRISIKWPAIVRAIPNSSESISITILKGTKQIAQQIVVRPTTGEFTNIVTMTGVPVGAETVSLASFPNTTATGVPQAVGQTPIQIAPDKPTTVSVTLASNVATLSILPSQLQLVVKHSATVNPSALDAKDQVVLLYSAQGQEPIQWKSDNPAIATITGTASAATVSGVSAGKTTISASYVLPGLTRTLLASIPVTVTTKSISGFQSGSPWPVLHADARNTGRAVANGGISTTIWSQGASEYSSPCVAADGTLYVGQGQNLASISSKGESGWSVATGYAAASSPAISSNGTVYFAGSDSYFYAVSPDGSVSWKLSCLGIESAASPTIGPDGTIYVASGNLPGPLVALDPVGKVKWRVGDAATPFSPAIGVDGTIYCSGSDRKLYAITPDGTIKWTYPAVGDQLLTPSIGDDGTIYVPATNSGLYAINPDGSLRWRKPMNIDDFFTVASIGFDGSVYIGSADGHLYAFTPGGGTIWAADLMSPSDIAGAPAITPSGNIYCSVALNSQGGGMALIEVSSSGNIVSTFRTPGSSESSPVVGNDGTVYYDAYFLRALKP